MLSRKL